MPYRQTDFEAGIVEQWYALIVSYPRPILIVKVSPPQPYYEASFYRQGVVEFRNPFDKPTDFSLQADNPWTFRRSDITTCRWRPKQAP